MKKKFLLLYSFILFVAVIAGCKKEEDAPGPSRRNGDVTFWNDQSWVGNITVTLNGNSDVIDDNVVAASCGLGGCANFYNLSYGTYSFTASATTGQTWSGSVTVNTSCTTFYLYED